MSTYWQIAAGSKGRKYSDKFLKFGMAFVGGETQIATMKKVSLGDIVVIKQGVHKIIAAGTVIKRNGRHNGYGDYDWLKDFDGWDLQAYCYVDWRKPMSAMLTSGLTIATIQKIHNEKHKAIANEILENGTPIIPIEEPKPTLKIDENTILKSLINEGLRPSSADDVTKTLSKIKLLAEYYYSNCNSNCKWEDIREHETRTFLVIPLLLALGWSEQQLKIELPCAGGRIDIACFSTNYKRDNNDCVAIIETKDFSSGLDYAPEQARTYSTYFQNCSNLSSSL